MKCRTMFSVAATLLLGSFSMISAAYGSEPVRDRDRDCDPATCTTFVDEDGDGSCDTCGTPHEGEQGRDRDREQQQLCEGPVDEDGDGICDLCGNDHDPLQDRDRDREQQQLCESFIDEDGDGVCDLCGGPHDEESQQKRRRFLRGDANADGRRDVLDAVTTLRALFGRGYLRCPDAADVDDNGEIDIADPLRLIWALHGGQGAPEIPSPRRNAGNDPTPDVLDC